MASRYRVVVVGPEHLSEAQKRMVWAKLEQATEPHRDIVQLLHGGSQTGTDQLVRLYAQYRHVEEEGTPLDPFHGKHAGSVRNSRWAAKGIQLVLLFLIHDGFVRWHYSLLRHAASVGAPVRVYPLV